MMNTDIMRQLVAEAELGNQDMVTAASAAALWGYDEASLRDLRYSANAIFIFKQQDSVRFMRLSWSGDHTLAQLQAELDYLSFLAQHKYPAVQPVPSLNGNRVERIENPYAAFYAVTFQTAKGKHVPIETLTEDQIRAWGALLGRLHELSSRYEKPESNRRLHWDEVLKRYAAWVPESTAHTRRYLDEAQRWLAQLPATTMHYGLIHWDFELDNLTWHDGSIEVIDFDDAAYFWFAADIAFALDDVLDEAPEQARYCVKHFLDGYRSVRGIDKDWITKLPFFVRLMRVLKTARVHHAYANTHPELDPTWLSDLRKRHLRWVQKLEKQFSQPFLIPFTSDEVAIWENLL